MIGVQHEWTRWELLTEPGISDIDGGRWARLAIVCERCGEERKVWRGVDRRSLALLNGCRGAAALAGVARWRRVWSARRPR